MHRIDTATKAVDLFGAGKHGWKNGDKANGIAATDATAEFFNDVQENLAGVVEGAGIALVKGDYTQLRAAITKMVQAGQRAVVIDSAVFNAGVANAHAVYWDAANNRFDKALADGSAKQNMVGIADVTNSKVYAFGDYTLMAGLTPGSRYYLDGITAGAITAVAPTNQVFVGIAKSATEIFVDIDTAGLTQAAGDARYLRVSNARTRLTANTTFYVATTGNDSNDGLSAGAPFLTIMKALNVLHDNYDLAGYTATIQLADGTYTSGNSISGPFVGAKSAGSVIIKGNSVSPANVLISTTSATCFQANYGAAFSVQYLKMQAATAGSCIVAQFSSEIQIGPGCIFGATAAENAQIAALYLSRVLVTAGYTISAGGGSHWYAAKGGEIYAAGNTVTLSGTPAFSSQFAYAEDCGDILCNSCTFTGGATGTRYSANTNSVINTSGGGASYLPGSVAGATATGGQYV